MAEARELLRRRGDVPEQDIDDIIGIAAELQQAERDRASAPTVEDVQRVASELDIEPAYVQQAIEVLGRRRAAATVRRQQARTALIGLAAAVGIALLVAAGLGGLGASQLSAAEAEVERTERALVVVLDRQAQLVPQLVAMAGGQLGAIPELPDDAPIEQRLAASEDLARSMARQLASLPAEAASEQIRLNLQHEITGATNRIGVERRRWEEARAARDAAGRSVLGRLAELFWR